MIHLSTLDRPPIPRQLDHLQSTEGGKVRKFTDGAIAWYYLGIVVQTGSTETAGLSAVQRRQRMPRNQMFAPVI